MSSERPRVTIRLSGYANLSTGEAKMCIDQALEGGLRSAGKPGRNYLGNNREAKINADTLPRDQSRTRLSLRIRYLKGPQDKERGEKSPD